MSIRTANDNPLLDYLASMPGQGDYLAGVIESSVRPRAAEIMDTVTKTFPSYTPHQVGHLDEVARNAYKLLEPKVLSHLNCQELFLLLAACYLHDIGMSENIPSRPSQSDLESTKQRLQITDPDVTDDAVLQQVIRSHHHIRAKEYISTQGAQLGLASLNVQQLRILGQLCAGHRVEDLRNASRFGIQYFGSNIPVHLNILAAYLRLADELDISANRTPLLQFRATNPTGISLTHWQMHTNVSGFGIEGHKLVVTGWCDDPDVFIALMELREKLNRTLLQTREALGNVYRFASQTTINDPIPYERIDFNVTADGFRDWLVKFDPDPASMTEILTSPLFYSRPEAAVRELLQNAVDACHLRQMTSSVGARYQPAIEIRVTSGPTRRVLTVSDNGAGISEIVARTRLGHVGRSYYRSEEFRELNSHMTPIGRFGIGLLSAFMLGHQLEIETLHTDSSPLCITITDPNQYFRIVDGSRQQLGTDVSISLFDHISNNLASAVHRYAVCLDVPLTVNMDNNTTLIPSRSIESLSSHAIWSQNAASEEYSQWLSTNITATYDHAQVRVALFAPNPESFSSQHNGFLNRSPVQWCNQGILIDEDRPGFLYASPSSRGGSRREREMTELPAYGLVNFLEHPASLSFNRDQLMDSPWTSQQLSIVRTVYSQAFQKSFVDIARQFDRGPEAVRFVLGYMLRHGVKQSDSFQSAPVVLDNVEISYCPDPDIESLLASLYGEHFPIAWKQGETAYLGTLKQFLELHPEESVICHRPDPAYPPFASNAISKLAPLSAVLDEPREFSLVKRYLTANGRSNPARLLGGIDLLEQEGFTFLSRPFSSIFTDIGVCEAPAQAKEWLLVIPDLGIFGDIDPPRTGHFGNRWGPLVALNRRHPLTEWLIQNHEQLTDEDSSLFTNLFFDLGRWALYKPLWNDFVSRGFPVLSDMPDSILEVRNRFRDRDDFPALNAESRGDLVLYSEQFAYWPLIHGTENWQPQLRTQVPSRWHTISTSGGQAAGRITAPGQYKWWDVSRNIRELAS